MASFNRPRRVMASAAGVAGGAALILFSRGAPAAADILFVVAAVWLFVWLAVRFAMDLNGIRERPIPFRWRINSAQYSLSQLWLDRL